MRNYPEFSDCNKMEEKHGDWLLLLLEELKEYCWYAVHFDFIIAFFCCVCIDHFVKLFIRLLPYHISNGSRGARGTIAPSCNLKEYRRVNIVI